MPNVRDNSQLTRSRPSRLNAPPSGIALLRKSSDQSNDNPDAMNLDEFIFADNISTPAGMSPSPELKEKEKERERKKESENEMKASKSSNAVASAIPIKTRKESTPNFVPQSVPVPQHSLRNQDEFGYVQRHIRKPSIDERRVRISFYRNKFICFCNSSRLRTNNCAAPKTAGRFFSSRTSYN
jgi:GATA-binding protein